MPPRPPCVAAAPPCMVVAAEGLAKDSPLEVCYYLGKLREDGHPLAKVQPKQTGQDRMMKVPLLG